MTARLYAALDTPALPRRARPRAPPRRPRRRHQAGAGILHRPRPGGVRQAGRAATPLFLDLKLHDIPNTVAGAVRAVAPLSPTMLTIHSSGGPAMMRAARKAAEEAAAQLNVRRPKLLAVTVLTSLDQNDLAAVGQSRHAPLDQVRRLAALAKACGWMASSARRSRSRAASRLRRAISCWWCRAFVRPAPRPATRSGS